MRDSLLAVSGALEPTMGGPAVPINEPPFSTRRTVYGFIDRQNLDGLYRTFDFAVPDATSPRRFVTTVPQQALFLMNSPFLHEQARRLTELIDVEPVSPASLASGFCRRARRGRAPHLSPGAGPVARSRRALPGDRLHSAASGNPCRTSWVPGGGRRGQGPIGCSRPGSSSVRCSC